MSIIQTSTITTEKKITRIVIDVEASSITFTIRSVTRDSANVEVGRDCHDCTISGAEFEALAAKVPEATLTYRDNLAAVSYACLQKEGAL